MNRLHRLAKVLMVAVIAITAVAASFATTPARADTYQCVPFHVVRPGENLFRIGLAYGFSWVVLAHYNGIHNPNRIHVGQVICIPPGGKNPPDPVTLPPPGAYYPPSGVIPFIDFNTRFARIGDTINIFGVRFPGGATVDIFIAPRIPGVPSTYPTTPSGTATVNADGTLATPFTIPSTVGGAPLVGNSFSILVRAQGSGYYAFNYVVVR